MCVLLPTISLKTLHERYPGKSMYAMRVYGSILNFIYGSEIYRSGETQKWNASKE